MGESKIRCSKLIWEGFWHRRCERNATIEYNRKWYCWQHDPSHVAKKRAEMEAEVQTSIKKHDTRVARLKRLKISLRNDAPSVVEQLLDLAEEQKRKIEALQKALGKTMRRKCGRD